MKEIPRHVTVPFPEAHPDRERVRVAAMEGFQSGDVAALTEAFCGLSPVERVRGWVWLTSARMGATDFAIFVHKACSELVFEAFSIPPGEAGIGIIPNDKHNIIEELKTSVAWCDSQDVVFAMRDE